MAMIQCRECGADISSEAKLCPHCGCPRKQRKRIPKKVIWCTLIVLALTIIVSAIVFVVSLFYVEGWSEKDLCLYDSSGEVVIELHKMGSSRLGHVGFERICDYCEDINKDNLYTHRDVTIGDNALDALKKYNLNGAYYRKDDNYIEIKNEDIESILSEDNIFSLSILFDENFNTLVREPGMEYYKYKVTFWIEYGVIEDYDVTSYE